MTMTELEISFKEQHGALPMNKEALEDLYIRKAGADRTSKKFAEIVEHQKDIQAIWKILVTSIDQN